jgi:hypothetical protein
MCGCTGSNPAPGGSSPEIAGLAAEHSTTDVDLFLGAPFPIAVLLGQMLNTLRVTTYEWDDSAIPQRCPYLDVEPRPWRCLPRRYTCPPKRLRDYAPPPGSSLLASVAPTGGLVERRFPERTRTRTHPGPCIPDPMYESAPSATAAGRPEAYCPGDDAGTPKAARTVATMRATKILRRVGLRDLAPGWRQSISR